MNEEKTQETYQNSTRDAATTGRSGVKFEPQTGLADEDQPQWQPPESMPEPRPVEPTLDADDGQPS